MAAYSVEPSGAWKGNDGRWSTFTIRVGTPPKVFEVLPSLINREMWVVNALYCEVIAAQTEDCGSRRGVVNDPAHSVSGGFAEHNSSTWKGIGEYALISMWTEGGSEAVWPNYTARGATYGLDLLQLHRGRAQNILIASVAAESFWLGTVGLRPQEIEIGPSPSPLGWPSLMSELIAQKLIPSLTFGYTAGAAYLSQWATLSLTLGGFDNSRKSSINLTLPFSPDPELPFVVGLQSVKVSFGVPDPIALLDGSISVLVDSTIPELWLPLSTCARIAITFGLQLDPASQRYLINTTMVERWRREKPTISLRIGAPGTDGGTTIDIELPYAAFDLQVSAPIFENETNYFPLRVATSERQYLLGRAFLQEAYIFVDWERNQFSLSQAVFTSPEIPRDLVTVPSANTSLIDTLSSDVVSGQIPTRASRTGLSDGAQGGIAAGTVTLAAALIFLMIWYFRRRKDRKLQDEGGFNGMPELNGTQKKMELETKEMCVEVHGVGDAQQADGEPIFEMLGSPVPELAAVQPAALKVVCASVEVVEDDKVEVEKVGD